MHLSFKNALKCVSKTQKEGWIFNHLPQNTNNYHIWTSKKVTQDTGRNSQVGKKKLLKKSITALPKLWRYPEIHTWVSNSKQIHLLWLSMSLACWVFNRNFMNVKHNPGWDRRRSWHLLFLQHPYVHGTSL